MESYFAVIFTSLRTDGDDGYEEMAKRMASLAARQPGFLGIDSARSEVGITVSYWSDLDSIRAWKLLAEHQMAQRLGRERWYSSYNVRICQVIREYRFEGAFSASE